MSPSTRSWRGARSQTTVLQLTFYSHELARHPGTDARSGCRSCLAPASRRSSDRRSSRRFIVGRGCGSRRRSGSGRRRIRTRSITAGSVPSSQFATRDGTSKDLSSASRTSGGIRSSALISPGISTLQTLGDLPPNDRPSRTYRPATFAALRHQAALQLEARRTGTHRYDLLAPEERRGLGLLPAPSPGDLFYDIEGDPFWEPGRGLEYLHGITDTDGRFTSIWAHDRDEERVALEQRRWSSSSRPNIRIPWRASTATSPVSRS